jgi:hypothetical protein
MNNHPGKRSVLSHLFAGVLISLLAAVALLLVTAPEVEAGRNPNPGVLPVDSNSHGKGYGEWSGAWWQWVYSIPAAMNPVSDQTGEFAAVGQSGSVWFLAGNFGGTTVRTVTVPAGKTLFFPIINTLWINLPEFGDDPWSDEQRAFARAVIAPTVDNAFNLSCTIDGVPVANINSYRAVTPDGAEYLVTLPDDNITGGVLAPGTYGPSVDDGIYLMLAPLRPGLHTIRITAASGEFALDVTYHLTVK